PRFDTFQRRLHERLALRLERLPLAFRQLAGHEPSPKCQERVARALCGNFLCALVRLRVLARMPREARHAQAQQYRTATAAYRRYRLVDERRCREVIRAVASQYLQVAKSSKVRRDIAARRLPRRGDRDAVAVVLDETEQRQA